MFLQLCLNRIYNHIQLLSVGKARSHGQGFHLEHVYFAKDLACNIAFHMVVAKKLCFPTSLEEKNPNLCILSFHKIWQSDNLSFSSSCKVEQGTALAPI